MTWSIVSSGANRLLGMTRCAGRSAFLSNAFGFVCLAIFSPNRGILSPGALPNQRNGPSDRVSGSKNIEDTGGGPLEQFDARGHVRTPCPSVARLELHVTGQPPEFQRQIIAAAVDLRPQDL